ncbi:MAG: hypothetical protein QNK92_13455 [Amylibacter sp.]
MTGGYSGLGLETVRALASKGAAVIVPVRTPAATAGFMAICRVPFQVAELP